MAEGKYMSLPPTDYFDANLPGASQTVRIASLYEPIREVLESDESDVIH